jgi:hypothetical protein
LNGWQRRASGPIQNGLTVLRSVAPQVAQRYSTFAPSLPRMCGTMLLIVIGRRFSHAGQVMIGISSAGGDFPLIDRNKPAAAKECVMECCTF